MHVKVVSSNPDAASTLIASDQDRRQDVGTILGTLGTLTGSSYERRTVKLAGGDVTVVFSDGIPEVRSRSGSLYGYDRPRDLRAGLDISTLSAENIRDTLIQDARRFAGSSHQSDDMTLVVIKPRSVRGPPAAHRSLGAAGRSIQLIPIHRPP